MLIISQLRDTLKYQLLGIARPEGERYLCKCNQGRPDGIEISHYSYRNQILLIVLDKRPSVMERLLSVMAGLEKKV